MLCHDPLAERFSCALVVKRGGGLLIDARNHGVCRPEPNTSFPSCDGADEADWLPVHRLLRLTHCLHSKYHLANCRTGKVVLRGDAHVRGSADIF